MTNEIKKYLLLLLVLLPLLTGCPYESSEALGEKENALVQKKIVGTWLSTRQPQQNRSVITIGEDNVYKIRHFREVNAKVEVSEFEAFITPVGNKYFVNVYEPDKRYTSGGYLIFMLEILDNNKIKLTEVDKYKVPAGINSKNALLQYIRAGVNDGSIFANSETWIRE